MLLSAFLTFGEYLNDGLVNTKGKNSISSKILLDAFDPAKYDYDVASLI